MTVYWILFAFPALMALAYPHDVSRGGFDLRQGFAFLTFLIFYALVAGLRHETGGDWLTYLEMFEDMQGESIFYAMTRTDPGFGVLNWISAQMGTGLYLVNGVCAGILGYGLISVATRMREPWLALTIAVPYLMIVVGMGYIRQGAAIGFALMAFAAFDQGRPIRTLTFLLLAVTFHSAAVMMLPLFAFAVARGRKVTAVIFILVGIFAYLFFLAPRLEQLEAGYLASEYESSGAFTRLLMGLLPAILLLSRWKHFPAGERIRPVWLATALASVGTFLALMLSPSSTAVDRVGLFYSVIQLAAFGEFRDLTGISARMTLFTRMMLVGVAALVQSVWLVFATHSNQWVPYAWVFDG
jgi:EpsG family